jgi:hypothetical protein
MSATWKISSPPTPTERRACVDQVTAALGASERWAYQVWDSTVRRSAKRHPGIDDEAALTADII